MASFHKPVAEIIPGMMALGLVGKTAKMATEWTAKPTDDSLKGNGKQGDLIKSSVEILIGVPLIGAVATGVAGL